MITGREDLTHDIDEVLNAYATAREPKHLELLPYDERGLTVEPGLGESMTLTIDWLDHHLRNVPAVTTSPVASEVKARGLRPEFQQTAN